MHIYWEMTQRRAGYRTEVNDCEGKNNSPGNRVSQQLHHVPKRDSRREPHGLAGTQQKMLRDKRHQVTSSRGGEQVEKPDSWKDLGSRAQPEHSM